MVTGASTADLAIVLVDARKGVVEQTRRHAFIASLLGIRARRRRGQQDGPRRLRRGGASTRSCASSARCRPRLRVRDDDVHPDQRAARRQRRRALGGDGLVRRRCRCSSTSRRSRSPPTATSTTLRFPVQWVIRDPAHATTAATPASSPAACCAPATRSSSCPPGSATTVAAVETLDGPLEAAVPPMSVTVRLADDARRLARRPALPPPATRPRWRASSRPTSAGWPTRRCAPGGRYALKHATHTARAIVDAVVDRVDVATLARDPSAQELGAQRHRPRAPAHRPTRSRSTPTPQPRDRLVHPHRRGDERHGRRGHDHGAVTPRAVRSRDARRGGGAGGARRRRLRRRQGRSPARARTRVAPCAAPAADPCGVPRGGELSLRVLPRTPPVIVHVPDGLRAGQRAPLVLGLHGAGQDARGFEAESNLSNVADEHHFVVAYPMSWRARGFWHYPEPDNPRSGLRLLRATLDAVRSAACVDAGRVLVTGISSGGRMTYAAGCELADRILAIAPVSGGTRELPPCHPARPISVLDVHGTSDTSPTAAAAPTTTGACPTSWTTGPSARAAAPRRASAASTPCRAPGLARVPRRRPRRAPAHRGRPARVAPARRARGHRHRRRRGDLALLRGAPVAIVPAPDRRSDIRSG